MFKFRIVPKKNPQTKEIKYYAHGEAVTPVRLEDVADEISRSCTVNRADIKAVLSALDDALIRYMVNGQSVRLGDLGSFHPRISSHGAEEAQDFKTAMIKGIHVRYTPSAKIKYLLRSPQVVYQRIVDPDVVSGEG